jgi:drug/metabolite transporter (DMT)-like permease
VLSSWLVYEDVKTGGQIVLNLLLLLVIGALWGASFMFIRIAVPEWGPVALIEGRVLLAGLALWLVLTALRRTRPQWRLQWRRYLMLGALSAALPFTLIATAEMHLSASLAAILNATTPLFTLLIGAARGQEPISARRLAGVGLGIAGVAVLVGFGRVTVDGAFVLAVAASLLAAFFYGIGGVYAKQHFAGVAPATVATGQQLSAAALLLPLVVLAPPPQVPTGGTTLAVAGLALPCTAVGFALFYRLVAQSGPTTALTVTYLVPLFGLFWGALVLDEPLNANIVAGMVIVLAGVGLVSRRGTAAAPSGPKVTETEKATT